MFLKLLEVVAFAEIGGFTYCTGGPGRPGMYFFIIGDYILHLLKRNRLIEKA